MSTWPQNFVYGLTDPETGDVRYVGRSAIGKKRPVRHAAPSTMRVDGSRKSLWVRDLISRGLRYGIVVLEVLHDRTALDAAERRWIARLRAEGRQLLNEAAGGPGCLGVKRSAETRRKQSDSARARTVPCLSGEAHPMFGKHHSRETRLKISMVKGCGPVIDSTGRVFESQSEAARVLGLDVSSICQVLKGKFKQTGGLSFRYVETH